MCVHEHFFTVLCIDWSSVIISKHYCRDHKDSESLGHAAGKGRTVFELEVTSALGCYEGRGTLT